jgi:O-antigen ligase
MKEILKYSIWAGIYAILIVPFIVASNMFFPYITGKAFTFRIIVEIIFGLWLILVLKDKEFRPKWSWVLGAFGLFTFILLIADINAVAPFKAFWSNYERMEGWVTFAHLFAYFLVIGSMFNKEKLWLWFLRANLVAGVVMAITSISAGAKESIVRIAGPLGNPIYISVYFMFIFFFTLILLYKDVLAKNLDNWKDFKKISQNVLFYIYLGASALSLFVVYRTSRGALLGVIGGIFVGAVLIAIFEKEKKVIKQIALGGIVLVFAVIMVFFFTRETQFVKNNPTLSRFAEISWSNLNGQARQLVWPMAIKGFKEKPLLGWGQEGFNYVFNKYYDPRMYGQETWFDRAHNAPLDFLVASGILGFLSYLTLFGSALYLLWLKKNNLSITEKALLTGSFAGYLFQAIFVFDNLVSYIMFFTTLAYVHSRVTDKSTADGILVKNGSKESEKVQGYLSFFVQNKEYQDYIIIPVVVILTIFSIWRVNIPGIKANQALIQSFRLVQDKNVLAGLEKFKLALSYESMGDSEIREQLLSYTPSILKASDINLETKKEFLTLTMNEVEKQIDRVPSDARYYILAGSLLNNIGSPEQALPYIKMAIELSPQKQAMRFELIQSLYSLGKSEETMLEAKSAYELDKNYGQAKQIYMATVQNEIKLNASFKLEGEKILSELAIK